MQIERLFGPYVGHGSSKSERYTGSHSPRSPERLGIKRCAILEPTGFIFPMIEHRFRSIVEGDGCASNEGWPAENARNEIAHEKRR